MSISGCVGKMHLNASALEDGDTAVCSSKIDSNDGSIIFFGIGAREERGQDTESSEKGRCP